MWVFHRSQGQVKLCRRVFPAQSFHRQAGQLTAALIVISDVGVLVVEHYLKQRAMTQATLGVQRFDELFEGQLLVGLGVKGCLFDLGQ